MDETNLFNKLSIKPEELSPAVWAYIGDAVYELYVRSTLIAKGPAKTRQLHHDAVTRVRASYQADLLMKLEPFLSDEEVNILKRGRNIKSGHVPPGSDPLTYRHSTAFEALIGFLFISGNQDRLMVLFDKITELSGGNLNVEG